MTKRSSRLRALVLPQLVAIDKKAVAMVKHVKAAKSVSSLPARHPIRTEEADVALSGWGVFPFPSQYRLIVTTTKGVYGWDIYGVSELFRSGSEGIVAAKKLENDKEMLAVADSQVVVLHEVKGETQKSYRLKGSEGRVRLLKYAKDSNNLLFTTTLQNSVQSYSLEDSKLLNTTHDHPTPPSVFAISCNSQFLLSTSVAPPTIHLTDLTINMKPILIRPECSSSPVVAAAFHPESICYFLLAFADGTAAVFGTMHFFRKPDGKNTGASPVISGTGGLLAFIRGLHAHGSSIGKEALQEGVSSDGVDSGTGVVGFGDKSWGITAVTFVPNRSATVITAGGDGKCCVVDFTQSTKKRAVLLKTWHLRRPATSLSVVCSAKKPVSQLDGTVEAPSASAVDSPGDAYYIAVGREDGRVLLFDLNGKPLGEQRVDDHGAPIVDVEWTQVGESEAAISRRYSSPATSCEASRRNEGKALEAAVLKQNASSQARTARAIPEANGAFGDEKIKGASPGSKPEVSIEKPHSKMSAIAINHLDFQQQQGASSGEISSGDTKLRFHHRSLDTYMKNSSKIVHRGTVGRSTSPQSYSTSEGMSTDNGAPPDVPPRPRPKPGGLLSIRRAQTSYHTPSDDSYSALISNARRARANLPTTTPTRFGPRPMPRRRGGRSSSQASTPPDQARSGPPDSTPLDAALISSSREPYVQSKSPTPSVESFQTASSQVRTSEGSTDTVVDWEVGPVRQPFPSLVQHPPPHVPPKQLKPKGHVSLPVSSVALESPSSDLAFNDTASPIIQWPDASPQYSGPGLHDLHGPTESPAMTRFKSKQTGHRSVPVSLVLDDSITPASSGSSGAIVQWPSLKKSPRIPELNKAISFSDRNSVTGLVLDTYMKSHSQSPPKNPSLRFHHDTAAAKSSESGSLLSKNYIANVENILNASLATFRAEMSMRFEEQRVWLEGLIRSEDEGRGMLEEENRYLRRELERLEGERESGSE